jgi:hypothetical protein
MGDTDERGSEQGSRDEKGSEGDGRHERASDARLWMLRWCAARGGGAAAAERWVGEGSGEVLRSREAQAM